jgi:hypothetical protein
MGSATAPECAAVRIEAPRTGPDRPGKVDPRRCLPGSSNPYATFDQGGNVWHWNEQIVNSPVFAARAGAFAAGVGVTTVEYELRRPDARTPAFSWIALGSRGSSLPLLRHAPASVGVFSFACGIVSPAATLALVVLSPAEVNSEG